jgi:hypothetical protein
MSLLCPSTNGRFDAALHDEPFRQSFSSAFSFDVNLVDHHPSTIRARSAAPNRLAGVHHFWWSSYRGCPRMPSCPSYCDWDLKGNDTMVTAPYGVQYSILHPYRTQRHRMLGAVLMDMYDLYITEGQYCTPYLRLSRPFPRLSAVPASD